MASDLDQICENVVVEIDDAVAFGVVDLQSGMLLGAHHTISYFTQDYLQAVAAASVDMFRGKTVTRVEQLLNKVRGDSKGTRYFEEVFASTKGTFHFMKVLQGNDAVAVLVTKKSANQGMGWAAMRRACNDLAGSLPALGKK